MNVRQDGLVYQNDPCVESRLDAYSIHQAQHCCRMPLSEHRGGAALS